MKKNTFKQMESNIISWYDFDFNSRILYIGNKESGIYEYLKNRCKYLDYVLKEKTYDYIIIIDKKIDIDLIDKTSKYLSDSGKMLIGFDNEFGISKFVTYDCDSRTSPLELCNGNAASLIDIENKLKQNEINNINLYIPFPNLKRTDLILTDKIENISERIDKYFLDYQDNMSILTDEIKLLRKIAKYNKELFINLSNSYLLEVSKKQIDTDIKYVSFNNYRKKEYQMITIIREDIVEKKINDRECLNNIKRISKNLEILKQYDYEILDKWENNKLYSQYIKEKKTFDIELGEKHDNTEFLINKLNELKELFIKNSVKYNPKIKKELIGPLKKLNDDFLSKFNFLEYAFYDMVPKNCFYFDQKYHFFDQEWMEKYLPAEFIIYRSIINSYDLVKNIDVDKLLQDMGLYEFRNIFEEIDSELRQRIIDEETLNELNKKYSKMYEVLYDKVVLSMQNEDYRQNDIKQNEYIKILESKLQQK